MTSETAFRRLAALSAAATYLLVVLGAVVRATGSGLGCPDWPRCHGSWIPPLEKTAIIEYSHRSLALVVGILVAAVVVTAWRRRRADRRSFLISLGAGGLLLLQAWLGRAVVLGELSPVMVTVHLATAMALLALLILLAVPGREAFAGKPSAQLWGLAAGIFLVIVLGALVRGESAGLAFPDWPLMGGRLIPDRLDLVAPLVHFLHRVAVLIVGGYLAYVAVSLRRSPEARMEARLATVLLVLYLVQVLIGAAAVWSRLDPLTVVGHVAVAALAWSAAFLLALVGRTDAKDRQPGRAATSSAP